MTLTNKLIQLSCIDSIRNSKGQIPLRGGVRGKKLRSGKAIPLLSTNHKTSFIHKVDLYCSGLDGGIPSLLIENDIFSETENASGIGWGEIKEPVTHWSLTIDLVISVRLV